jgi:hypothetical protein
MSASSNGPAMSLFPELIQGSIAKFRDRIRHGDGKLFGRTKHNQRLTVDVCCQSIGKRRIRLELGCIERLTASPNRQDRDCDHHYQNTNGFASPWSY